MLLSIFILIYLTVIDGLQEYSYRSKNEADSLYTQMEEYIKGDVSDDINRMTEIYHQDYGATAGWESFKDCKK